MPGFAELIVLLVILGIVFGAHWVPAIGRSVGRLAAGNDPGTKAPKGPTS